MGGTGAVGAAPAAASLSPSRGRGRRAVVGEPVRVADHGRRRVHRRVEARVEPVPDGRAAEGDVGPEGPVVGVVGRVEVVGLGGGVEGVGPDGDGALRAAHDPLAVALRVAEEGAEEARGDAVGDEDEEVLVELEGAGELRPHEVDGLEPLDEDGRPLVRLERLLARDADALRELVAEGAPLLLDEDGEALEGAVVGVEEELGRRADLRRPVPAVAAVDEDARALGVEALRDVDRGLEDEDEVLEPARRVEGRGVEGVVLGGREERDERGLRLAPGQEKGDSTSLQRGLSARARSKERRTRSRPFREMITRPKISQNEWKTTEI